MEENSSETMAYFPPGGNVHESQNEPHDEDYHLTSGQGEYNENNNYCTEEGGDNQFTQAEGTQEDPTNGYEENQHMTDQTGHLMEDEENGHLEDTGFSMTDTEGQILETGDHMVESGDHMTKEGANTGDSSQVKEVIGHMSREDIEASLEQILEDVRVKRENDLKIVSEVKAEIMAQAEKACEALDQHMYSLHNRRTTEMNDKVASLGELLEKIKAGETKLAQTKEALRGLCEPLMYSL